MNKHALIIGNSLYNGAPPLRTPLADATRLSETLEKLGFKAQVYIDIHLRDFPKAITNFLSNINNTDVVAFFYSGHGVQIKGINYLVPVDFRIGEAKVGLIDVNDIVGRMAIAAQRIIFLDACRSSGLINSTIKDRSSILISETKEIYIDDVSEVRQGFAEMTASSNTFIGFAAAPGEVAFEGEGVLSPFTEALVEHVSAVDVPLSNLAARVRKTVLLKTYGQQHTWDQSSLTTPFYFNRDTSLLYVYNLTTLLILIISTIPFEFLIWEIDRLGTSYIWPIIALTFPTAALLVFLGGIWSTYIRLRDDSGSSSCIPDTFLDYLFYSLKRGCICGFIGSIFGSTIMGVVFYRMAYSRYLDFPFSTDRPNGGIIMTNITIAAVLFSSIFSSMAIFFSRINFGGRSFSVAKMDSDFNTMIGSILSGLISCLVAAPLAMLYFGRMSGPEMKPNSLLPISIFIASIFVFLIVVFDIDGLTRIRLKAAACASAASVALGTMMAVVVFGPLYSFHIVDSIIVLLEKNERDTLIMSFGGVAYGIPVGLILGSIVGFAFILTRRWSMRFRGKQTSKRGG